VFAVASEGAGRPAGRVLAAPGRDVPTTMTGARWGIVSGSSYAAAHISGLMAVLSELKPQMPLAQLRDSLVASPTSIDLCATMTRISGRCSCGCGKSTAAHYARSP
jgi:subtilisin family serine protease